MPFEDRHFDLSYVVTLTALQTLPPQAVPLDKDADFIWEGVQVAYQGNGGNPGLPFGVIFTDSTKYQMSDDYMGNFAFAANTGIGVPYVLSTPVFFPAGSSIVLDLTNFANATNGPIQFIFQGRKRFYN
jgi:hypothetical protein